MATPTIEITTRYQARCADCRWTETTTTQRSAEDAADVHRHKHAAWAMVGATLVGKVFGLPQLDFHYQIVWDAMDAAKAAGYSFIAWNGQVYAVGNFGENSQLCRVGDVKGPLR